MYVSVLLQTRKTVHFCFRKKSPGHGYPNRYGIPHSFIVKLLFIAKHFTNKTTVFMQKNIGM